MIEKCPDPEQLERFALGELSDEACNRIALHVHECRNCDDALALLDSNTDPLLEQLGQLSSLEATPDSLRADFPEQLPDEIIQSIQSDSVIGPLDAGKRLVRQMHSGDCMLGKFRLLEELGVGSFGHVFRALDTELDRIIAIKVQRSGRIVTEEDQQRFVREIRSASALQHPHIVTLHEAGQTVDGVHYLVSEFIDGETLQARVARDRFSAADAANLVLQLAQGVHYAHESGVIHRDIKPSNVLLDGKGCPYLTDFGLAKRESLDATLTSEGHVVGTPAYMSPEHASGDVNNADRRADIYSLGVVLYELLTGQRPFHGSGRMLLLQVLQDEPKSPRQLDHSIPRDLETICLKAMAKQPSRRYQTAASLAQDIEAYLAGDPIRARPVGYSERLWKWCRKYPLAAALFFGMTIGSIAGFTYLRHLNTWFVREMALDTARQYSDALEEFNATYSDVRGEFFGHGEDTGTVPPPLPATLQIEVAKRISQRDDGMQVRIFSEYSFREELRPSDRFEEKTLATFQALLDADPDSEQQLEYYEFQLDRDQPALVFARGQRMKQSCLDCHNTHRDSPKRDWAKGDLAGVLKLTRPLNLAIARTQDGFRGAWMLWMAIAALLTLFGLAVTWRPDRSSARKVQ